MVIIHKKKEGERYKLGINWSRNTCTKFCVVVVIPIWLTSRHTHFEFDTGDLVFSGFIKTVCIGFRINKNSKLFWRCFKSQLEYGKMLILTEEQITQKIKGEDYGLNHR